MTGGDTGADETRSIAGSVIGGTPFTRSWTTCRASESPGALIGGRCRSTMIRLTRPAPGWAVGRIRFSA